MGVVGSKSKSGDSDELFKDVDKRIEKKKSEVVPELGYAIKLVAVGGRDSGVGRILDIYRGISFEDDEAYSGVDFFTKEIRFNKTSIRMTIWDYRMSNISSLIESIFRGSNGIIMGYDPSIQSTFEEIPRWVEEIKKNISPDVTFNERCQFAIVAKTRKKQVLTSQQPEKVININNPYSEFDDLFGEERVVSEESAKGYAEKYQYLYYEVNVDDPSNIDQPFEGIAKRIFEKHVNEGRENEIMFRGNIGVQTQSLHGKIHRKKK